MKQLEDKKNAEREERVLNQIDKEQKTKKFKENAAKQREKIKVMKNEDSPTREEFVNNE